MPLSSFFSLCILLLPTSPPNFYPGFTSTTDFRLVRSRGLLTPPTPDFRLHTLSTSDFHPLGSTVLTATYGWRKDEVGTAAWEQVIDDGVDGSYTTFQVASEQWGHQSQSVHGGGVMPYKFSSQCGIIL
ncbi:hypothetical protein C2E23DRAFT_863938 [Lenzites betulinus]|nr:hypothetical protein C2E23DRAFT_863938 [Lenzites betulinus]